MSSRDRSTDIYIFSKSIQLLLTKVRNLTTPKLLAINRSDGTMGSTNFSGIESFLAQNVKSKRKNFIKY